MAEDSIRTRIWLCLSGTALVALVVGVSIISAQDPDGMLLRAGMIFVTIGLAMWLPLPAAVAVVPAVWLGPNFLRSTVSDFTLFQSWMWFELAGLAGIAVSASLTRRQLSLMEEENDAMHGYGGLQSEVDDETGVYQERLLNESIDRELVRSRRFGREFAVMLAGIDEMRLKFDYREDEKWDAGLKATAAVLLNTRHHIDRVYRFGEHGFALLLPETGPKEITGLVRRLARTAKKAEPPEGEPGGPLPLHFGVTFFPQCATTVDDLLRRAEVAVRLAEKNPSRVQLDGAEAPDLPSPELMRKEDDEDEAQIGALAGQWLGAEAPDEERPGVWLTQPASVQYVLAPATEGHLAPAPEPEELAASLNGAQTPALAGKFDWQDLEASPMPAQAALTTPEIPLAASDATEPSIDPEPTDDAVSGLLKRLDETLDLIRSMKAPAGG
jgi:diguanylate cyclase (GGDEF)-like protein